MSLLVKGTLGEFYYEKPRAGIAAEGAKPGTLLFSGNVGAGGTISGTAWVFSKRCGPRSYPVKGSVVENGGVVVMRGIVSTITHTCEVKSAINDSLVFTYLYSQ